MQCRFRFFNRYLFIAFKLCVQSYTSVQHNRPTPKMWTICATLPHIYRVTHVTSHAIVVHTVCVCASAACDQSSTRAAPSPDSDSAKIKFKPKSPVTENPVYVYIYLLYHESHHLAYFGRIFGTSSESLIRENIDTLCTVVIS